MGIKRIYPIFIILSVYLIQHINAYPSDSSVAKIKLNRVPSSSVKASPEQVVHESDKIPGRVNCPFEEATEDALCQEHCLPKGYSYGICVRGTCSCI